MSSSFGRRRCLAFLAASLAGCAAILGPRTVTISEAELAQRIGERFPVDRRLLDLFNIRLGAPRVQLRPETNRIAMDFDARVDERLSQRGWPVSMALDSGLRYDYDNASVRLVDVRVTQLRVEGLPASVGRAFDRVAVLLAEQVLEDAEVHRFRPEQVQRVAERGYEPEAIRVTSRGLEVRLVPQGTSAARRMR